MKKIHWQLNFRDLPEIPQSKRWSSKRLDTIEQEISLKLINNQKISDAERQIMNDMTAFYDELFIKLNSLDYSNFTRLDFINFSNYIRYAYNYTVLISNTKYFSQLYRVVINEDIIGTNNSIIKKGFLTYPPLHVVRKNKKYNRANSPKTTVFYGSETIDTALNELKPQIGQKVTIGIWKPNHSNGMNCYPISHSNKAFEVNESSTRALKAFQDLKGQQDETLVSYMDSYLKVLGREFTKSISHHYEYFISSMFSESILDNSTRIDSPFEFDAIVYPSVGNNLETSNVAIKKEHFRHNFSLHQVIEFVVTNTNYRPIKNYTDESINIVEYKDYRQAKDLMDNRIKW